MADTRQKATLKTDVSTAEVSTVTRQRALRTYSGSPDPSGRLFPPPALEPASVEHTPILAPAGLSWPMSRGGQGQAATQTNSCSRGHTDPAAPRFPGQAGFQDLVTPGQMCPAEDRLTCAWDPPFTGAFSGRPPDEARAWLAAGNEGAEWGSRVAPAAEETQVVGLEQASASQTRLTGAPSLLASLLLFLS